MTSLKNVLSVCISACHFLSLKCLWQNQNQADCSTSASMVFRSLGSEVTATLVINFKHVLSNYETISAAPEPQSHLRAQGCMLYYSSGIWPDRISHCEWLDCRFTHLQYPLIFISCPRQNKSVIHIGRMWLKQRVICFKILSISLHSYLFHSHICIGYEQSSSLLNSQKNQWFPWYSVVGDGSMTMIIALASKISKSPCPLKQIEGS